MLHQIWYQNSIPYPSSSSSFFPLILVFETKITKKSNKEKETKKIIQIKNNQRQKSKEKKAKNENKKTNKKGIEEENWEKKFKFCFSKFSVDSINNKATPTSLNDTIIINIILIVYHLQIAKSST